MYLTLARFRVYILGSTIISDWKRLLLEEGASVFRRNGSDFQREHEELQAALYEQIGRLKMELEWLKRKVALRA